jgi:hypothetical protein
MIEFIDTVRPEAIGISVSGEITMDDYNKITPVIESKIQEHGKIPILLRLGEIDGASAKTMYEGAKFDLKHLKDITKIAVVADERKYEWLVKIAKPFIPAEVRLFKPEEEGSALSWILT